MILCRRCGYRVTPVYGDEKYHPSCDPSPRTWTLAEIDLWTAHRRRRLNIQADRGFSGDDPAAARSADPAS